MKLINKLIMFDESFVSGRGLEANITINARGSEIFCKRFPF